MKNQVLSINQMQELIELGISISKASICWIGCADGNDVYPYNSTFKDIFENHKETMPTVLTPTFSLQDILDMLPRAWEIGAYNANRNTITVFLDDEIGYCHQEVSDSLLEAAFNMLKWCKQNNYI